MRKQVLMVVILAMVATLGVGCADEAESRVPQDGDGAPWPGEGAEVSPHALGGGLVVRLPSGWEITPLGSPDLQERVCPQLFGQLSDGDELIDLELNAMACTNQEQEDIGNGHHGTYVSLDDVPAPLDVEEHDVPLGHLTVFSQDYYECTNECTDHQDNVALLVFAPLRPDPEYATLVLVDAKGDVPRDRLVALAEHILPDMSDVFTPEVLDEMEDDPPDG